MAPNRAERRAARRLDPTVAELADTSMAVVERAVAIDQENQRLRAALRLCVETAAECRRWLMPGGMAKDRNPDHQLPDYRTYRQVWDASRDAEVEAVKLLGGDTTHAD